MQGARIAKAESPAAELSDPLIGLAYSEDVLEPGVALRDAHPDQLLLLALQHRLRECTVYASIANAWAQDYGRSVVTGFMVLMRHWRRFVCGIGGAKDHRFQQETKHGRVGLRSAIGRAILVYASAHLCSRRHCAGLPTL